MLLSRSRFWPTLERASRFAHGTTYLRGAIAAAHFGSFFVLPAEAAAPVTDAKAYDAKAYDAKVEHIVDRTAERLAPGKL
jgi:hypothetical protein